MEDELHSCPGILKVHEQVPGLLNDPGLDGVLRGAQDPDAPAAVLDHREDVYLRAIEQVGGERSPAPGFPAPGIAGTLPTQGRPGGAPGRLRRP
jgi:hypothetical protein